VLAGSLAQDLVLPCNVDALPAALMEGILTFLVGLAKSRDPKGRLSFSRSANGP
jgi:hypothetical protein